MIWNWTGRIWTGNVERKFNYLIQIFTIDINMRLYDTKRDSDSIEDEESTYPFRMTKAELQSLDPNFKEKKKKVFIKKFEIRYCSKFY